MVKQRHTMTKLRWAGVAFGAAALALAFLLSDDVTTLFVTGYAVTIGLGVLIASELIIARTRSHPQTRLANARQGTGTIER